MALGNLTIEEFLMLAEEESKASINIGRRPHPSAFPSEKLVELVKRPSAKGGASPRVGSRTRANQKAS